jgi:hypothetical protein
MTLNHAQCNGFRLIIGLDAVIGFAGLLRSDS